MRNTASDNYARYQQPNAPSTQLHYLTAPSSLPYFDQRYRSYFYLLVSLSDSTSVIDRLRLRVIDGLCLGSIAFRLTNGAGMVNRARVISGCCIADWCTALLCDSPSMITSDSMPLSLGVRSASPRSTRTLFCDGACVIASSSVINWCSALSDSPCVVSGDRMSFSLGMSPDFGSFTLLARAVASWSGDGNY